MIAHSRRGALPAAGALLLAIAAGCRAAPDPPPSARALFVSDRGGAARLYELDDAGGSVSLVGSDDAGDPAWVDAQPIRLADGRIVFVSTRGGAAALYVAAGGAPARLLFASAGPGAPADSDPAPCGADRILFARAPAAGSPRDLMVARLDGSDARPLTRAPADDGAPCLLPDRRTVIFVSDRGGAPRLHRLDLDAADPEAGVTAVAAGGAADAAGLVDSAPACLEDGSILFSRSIGGRPRQVMIFAPGAAAAPRLLTDPAVLPYGAGEPVPIGGGRFLLTAGPGKGPGGRPIHGVYRLTTGGYNLVRITREGAEYSDFTRGLELLR